jgi:uncharacterized delta-60 repeat protein
MTPNHLKTTIMRNVSTLFIAVLLASGIIAQEPGTLDLSFANNGISLQSYGLSTMGRAMKVLDDDKILVAGIAEHQTGSNGFVAKYLPDGELDIDFGASGFVILSTPGLYTSFYALKVLADDKIVVAGKAYLNGKDHMALMKLHSSGEIDDDFGLNGSVLVEFDAGAGEQCFAIEEDSEGRLLLAGGTWTESSPRPILARLTAAGAIDTSFGDDGFIVPDFTSEMQFPMAKYTCLALQDDGKIIAGGYYGAPLALSFLVSRFDENGISDVNFANLGHFELGSAIGEYEVHALHVLDEGQILVAGKVNITSVPAFGLMRLDESGAPDMSFGQFGFASPLISLNGSFVFDMAVHPDGNILLAGSSNQGFAVARFLPTGFIDFDFSEFGVAITEVSGGFGQAHAVGVQSTGKILVAGFQHSNQNFMNQAAVLRYHAEIETTGFDEQLLAEFKVFPNPFSESFTIQADLASPQNLHFSLFDLNGKLLKQPASQFVNSGKQQVTFTALNDLPAGVYVLQVAGDEQQSAIRILKH